ncbi:transglutaminase family protein [Nocardia sp. 2]|uniref:Transglutaminase family protein n=1 Tax=Nocardia acididurans TaxID=2802282 RepID=A0ABS1M0D9_9NOCA|nr:transglutaminase family protein [Nocardia acididurans]MBL1073515.1 transglutaminase family protein [Nocardia acididurans]
MGIKVSLEHRTTYTFDRPVLIHPHVVRLRPAPHTRTAIEAYSMHVTPAEHWVNWQQDVFGNFLARLIFHEPARELSVTVGLIADLEVLNPFDLFAEDYAQHFPFEYPPQLAADLEAYLRPVDEYESGSGPGESVREWVRAHYPDDRPKSIDFLVDVNRALHRAVGYTIRMEPGVQSPDHTLRTRLGSCRDSAWLLVSIMREFGLAARFVSGYLIQLAQDVPSLDGPSGPPADFTDLHAWTEVYLPGAGWIGLDPTSGLWASEGHIPLAATPHPVSSAPITGATEPVKATLDFSNTVRRIHEDPRVTLPYSDIQWGRIADLGALVDRRSDAAGIGLTIGGEPTFVSIDDQTSPEWTTDADGPHKRERAADLAQRLRRLYAPHGLMQYRQGKWYPGEPLPRWDIALLWRADGEPLWRNPDLLTDPWLPPDPPGEHAVPPEAARAVIEHVARGLGLPLTQIRPAYEDALLRLAAKTRAPEGDPVESEDDLAPGEDSAQARKAMLVALDAPVDEPAAYVLSLYRRADEGGWASADWKLRRGRIVLTEGDSPAGLRLPLGAITWQAPARRPDSDPVIVHPLRAVTETEVGSAEQAWAAVAAASSAGERALDATVEREHATGALPTAPGAAADREPPGTGAGAAARLRGEPPAVVEPADRAPITALVAEVRHGQLFVFLPPVEELEAFLDLVRRLEAAVAAVGQPIVLEGYGPPVDTRLQSLSITPDPGVIEVNVQPTASFAAQARLLENLYEQARLARLSTESFDVDGTHSGTGGGNHITLGGRTPARSPLLRRPDLLVSMLTYWQRHPALSYLFSGRFIGPTSQAPRVDEARADSLYELEIAFAEIARLSRIHAEEQQPDAAAGPPEPTETACAPWEIDRALRHLLTDLTGNTHRAEFCIDKLYSPESARGRLGLVELRGFEMPPHFRMAMVQSLLVRALVLRFWERPCTAPLLRHGANLHGRYLLPHFLLADIADVAADLRSHGIEFDISWLDPFSEFRFPRIGTVVLGDMEVELRSAIEPWNTLGEQTVASGTARYVDSSVERLQVRVTGADRGRYAVTCNGFPVPLLVTDKADTQVAGVRYRAWQPPNSLHPTITVDAPLVFDVVDLDTGLSRGGCTYHVSDPGGLFYDTPPVNALAAQSRRNRRFEPYGHTPGPVDIAALRAKMAIQATDIGAPGILDLRRARTVWGTARDR